MSAIRKFLLRDVRCFDGEHEFMIRPLTFLVGENSTGKTTLLGCLQALSDFLDSRRRPDIDFNAEPYQMGAFGDIVRRSRPKKHEFQLGLETQYGDQQKLSYFLTLGEKERGSEPVVHGALWAFDDGEIRFSQRAGHEPFSEVSLSRHNKFQVQVNMPWLHWHLFDFDHAVRLVLSTLSVDADDGARQLRRYVTHKNKGFFSRVSEELAMHSIKEFFARWDEAGSIFEAPLRLSLPLSTHSIAPVRSRPKRTYDPLKETEAPDGSEIPVALMNLSISRTTEWDGLRRKLIDFGQASGLFSDIAMRKLGGSRGDPFQLQIKVNGPRANLMDVGYGVSQVLPILVRILTGRDATFLLQQPEVHLHPKGQAELASLLVGLYRTQNTSFVVETHSDHMIDRVRIEIKRGRINPDDVSLIYFEPVGKHVKTHNIGFDAHANMVGVPQHYRDFFLDEADRLLGLAD